MGNVPDVPVIETVQGELSNCADGNANSLRTAIYNLSYLSYSLFSQEIFQNPFYIPVIKNCQLGF